MNTSYHPLENTPSPLRVHMEDDQAIDQLTDHLFTAISENRRKELVILCIGTDRSTGDSLGPLVGSILEQHVLSHFHVYGTLEDPIHAVNLKDKVDHIKRLHPHSFILAVDACLGRLTSVGMITMADGPLLPGAAVKKKLPAIGDMHIAGIVNVGGMMEYVVLQNTRLHKVLKMAEAIASVMIKADSRLTLTYHKPTLFSDARSSFSKLFTQKRLDNKKGLIQ